MQELRDELVRTYTADGSASVRVLTATGLVREAARRHATSPTATVALGRALMGTLLLANGGQDGERVQLHVRGDGPLGAILVTAQTFRLTDGYFEFEALGETPIKGLEQPLAIYELRGVGQLRTRLEVSERRGLTRFVGRQSEVSQLSRAYAETREGHGQIVGVVGDPGLGKSRLFYEFKRTVDRDCLLLEAFSISHAKASPYVPVIELLHAYFDIDTNDDERRRREKVTGKVLALDRKLEETLPYLFALLLIGAVSSNIQQMEPQLRRARTVAAVKQLLLRESLDQPLIVIFEDLHWIDAETQALLDTLAEA